MNRSEHMAAGMALLALASSFQACSSDEVGPSGEAGSGGTLADASTPSAPDAGDPHSAGDASTPAPLVDAGSAGSNGEPDSGDLALPQLVARKLCVVGVDSLATLGFPALEVTGDFQVADVRQFSELGAVDAVNGEIFVQRILSFYDSSTSTIALDVFDVDASGFDAPLRSIQLAEDDQRPLAMTVDTDNDTLVLLSQGDGVLRLSTYARTAAGEATPLRSMELTTPFTYLPGYAVAVDATRARVFVATGSLLRTFPLTGTGLTLPLESIEEGGTRLAISAARNELYLQGSNFVSTFALDAPLADPPERTLYWSADHLLVDDVNEELWGSSNGQWFVYDLEADGSAAPLASGFLRTPMSRSPKLVAVLPTRGEVLAQVSGLAQRRPSGSIVAYDRDRPADAEPLRVLAAGDDERRINMDFVGVNRERNEVILRDARNGFIATYPLAATGVTEPLRRFGHVGWVYSNDVDETTYVDTPGTAYAEAEGLIFASGALAVSAFPTFAPISHYADNAQGIVPPDGEVGRDLFRMEVAAGRAELLGVKPATYPGGPTVLEAYSLAPSVFGVLQRSFDLPSPRPAPPSMWRSLRPIDVAHDPVRDEVIVAVEDCLEYDGGAPSDCHFDLKLFPRNAGSTPPVETVELPHSLVSLEVDEVNALLLVFGERGMSFYARPQLSSAAGQLGIAGEPRLTSEHPSYGGYEGHALVRYCD